MGAVNHHNLRPFGDSIMEFQKIKRLPQQLLSAIAVEGVATRQMVHVYARHGRGKLHLSPPQQQPSNEELRMASEQLKDIPRSLIFLLMFLIPIPGFVGGYALIAIALEKSCGDKIQLLPTRFRSFWRS